MKCRAIDIDGKEVVGWYFQTKHENHCLIPQNKELDKYIPLAGRCRWDIHGIIQIPDISLCAVATGRKDKNDVEIFGSKGEMQGGDKVNYLGKFAGTVHWDNVYSAWALDSATLFHYVLNELEIIPKEKENETT